MLRTIVAALRAAWPGVRIVVRGDTAMAVPAVLDFCEAEGLEYIFGYATNAVLERATAQALADVELYYRCYGRCDPHVQRFEEIRGYQAQSWPQPRRVVAKIEHTPQGSQRRFVVTNRAGTPEDLYRGVYVQRGGVPEQPISELKHGLRGDRLSACGFSANAFRLLIHLVAYALVVLFREASAAITEVATATVTTLRQRLWKAGAVLVTSARRIGLHVSATWPGRELWCRVLRGVASFVGQLAAGRPPAGGGGMVVG